MSLASHLTELRRKHEMLSATIEQEERRPGVDHLRIANMKREKLKLKEQIARASRDVH